MALKKNNEGLSIFTGQPCNRIIIIRILQNMMRITAALDRYEKILFKMYHNVSRYGNVPVDSSLP